MVQPIVLRLDLETCEAEIGIGHGPGEMRSLREYCGVVRQWWAPAGLSPAQADEILHRTLPLLDRVHRGAHVRRTRDGRWRVGLNEDGLAASALVADSLAEEQPHPYVGPAESLGMADPEALHGMGITADTTDADLRKIARVENTLALQSGCSAGDLLDVATEYRNGLAAVHTV
jgi:hypothetical protein